MTIALAVIAAALVLGLVSGVAVRQGRRRTSRPAGTIVEVTRTEVVSAPPPEAVAEAPPAEEQVVTEVLVPPAPSAPPGLGGRLGRARQLLANPLAALRSRPRVDPAALEELEEALILADVGVTTTTALLEGVREQLRRSGSADATELIASLKADILALFAEEDRALHLAEEAPSVWLFVGVNGVGKTTTIGKLARRETLDGRRVVLAAGDTFRAAAGEQLATWAERSGADIVQGADGADPSSVVFDAIQHAAARGADLVLADSAGRLHTKTNLMDELRKVRRIADRPPGHVSEVLLVLDATTGQNGLAQARQFTEAVGVTGIVLTKLDGTAKGGIVLAIRAELGLPIKLVGLGEAAEDLVEFDPTEFVDALFD